MNHLDALSRITRLRVTDNPAGALKLLDDTILDSETPDALVEFLRIARPGFVAEAKIAAPSEFAKWLGKFGRKAKEI